RLPRNLLHPQVPIVLHKVRAVLVRRGHARRAVDDGVLLYARAPTLAILGLDIHRLAVALLEVERDWGDGVAVLLRRRASRDVGDTACAVITFRNGKIK